MIKNSKTLLSIVLAIALGSSLLAGCSSSDSSSSTNGKVKLELFSTKTENKDIYQKMVSDFQVKNPNIQIVLNVPPDAGTVLKTRLTKNDMPDILSMGGDNLYGELATNGVLLDLSKESFMSNIQTAYIKQMNDLLTNGDKNAYGVPYATNAGGVLYNKEKFIKLGLKIPKTWDEFVTISEKIKASGETPFYLTLKDAWTGMCFWNILASDIAPKTFLADRKADKTTFEATHSEIADKMLEIIKYGQKDIYGMGYNDGNKAFAQGKSVMYLQGNWAISDIKKTNPNIKMGMFALPATNDIAKNKITSGVDVALAITKNSKHPAEAKKFIEYMLQKENAQKYINNQFAFSAVKDVVQKDDSVTDLADGFKKGEIGSFADHYYPTGLDTASIVQGFLNKKDKVAFLKKLDTEYNKNNKK
ncbi:extracellular solute-binding protein [Clostridium estertheticum]|uniref:ABC transporter substrate-binding protein n=1 Tax=Clostridium estertheticum TaxID=238834 RepID=UPI001C0AB232|nr:extracellular solute-binding protein [Clostridium estertheticum]MBU3216355.1 extracellular solute-binding protein [Clostridium estertheticum]WAG55413.1 extracellular solute-binding protein [Clostridium estertheticum]